MSAIRTDAPAPSAQEQFYGLGHDYSDGAPHIRHHVLRAKIVERLRCVVGELMDARGTCRVLEVGAGHGTFIDHLVALGAEVVVTEMSAPSAARLRARFRHNPRVSVQLDPEGVGPSPDERFDLVVCLSVLHHIPDYAAAVARYVAQIGSGGAFVSFQDPLRYSRRAWSSRLLERLLYLAWRLPRGDLQEGLAATVRRARGRHDETRPSDVVEYHVVRDGVDEQRLQALLDGAFAGTELVTYWSAQAGWAQAWGQRFAAPTTFGLVARRRK
jgi:SAM-dependent methyltransferase